MRESWLIAVERFLDRDVTNARRVFFLTMWLYRRRKRRRKKKKERKRKSIDALVCTSVEITWNFIHFRMLFLLRKSFVFLILLSRYLHFCILLLFFSPHSNKQYFSYIWLVSRGNVHEFLDVWQIFMVFNASRYYFDRFVSWPIFRHIARVCVSGNEYNWKRRKNVPKKNPNLPCDGKYGKSWYSHCSDTRGVVFHLFHCAFNVLVRFAAFFAFYDYISFTYIYVIYMYIYIYCYTFAYNFNLYTYMIFIILTIFFIVLFRYCKHGSLFLLSDYLINIIL